MKGDYGNKPPCGAQKNKANLPTGQVGAKSYMKGDYGNKPPCGAQKNKANLV